MSKRKRLVYDSKAGRVAIWILGVLALVFGLAVVACYVFCNNGDVFVEELISGCLAVLFGILEIVILVRSKRLLAKCDEKEEETGDEEKEFVAEEPDERVVIFPTRIKEPDGSVLIYRDKGALVYNGVQIPLDSIKDVSFNNVALAYLPTSYDILLTLNDGYVVHIPAGMDRMQVEEITVNLQEALSR